MNLVDRGEKRIKIENFIHDTMKISIIDNIEEFESVYLSNKEVIRLAAELLAYSTEGEYYD
jgi:hypothetical protein